MLGLGRSRKGSADDERSDERLTSREDRGRVDATVCGSGGRDDRSVGDREDPDPARCIDSVDVILYRFAAVPGAPLDEIDPHPDVALSHRRFLTPGAYADEIVAFSGAPAVGTMLPAAFGEYWFIEPDAGLFLAGVVSPDDQLSADLAVELAAETFSTFEVS